MNIIYSLLRDPFMLRYFQKVVMCIFSTSNELDVRCYDVNDIQQYLERSNFFKIQENNISFAFLLYEKSFQPIFL